MRSVLRWTSMLSLLLTLLTAPAAAVVVSYVAQDLADEVGGEDLWAYEYRLDEFPFDAGYGFTVYFDPALYADLDPSPPLPGPAWDPITLEPDPGLGDEGLYDAEALTDAPPIDVVFTVAFRWLGAGAPGPQPFEVREPAPSYAVVESGTTVLPETAATALGAGALAALATLRRVAA